MRIPLKRPVVDHAPVFHQRIVKEQWHGTALLVHEAQVQLHICGQQNAADASTQGQDTLGAVAEEGQQKGRDVAALAACGRAGVLRVEGSRAVHWGLGEADRAAAIGAAVVKAQGTVLAAVPLLSIL